MIDIEVGGYYAIGGKYIPVPVTATYRKYAWLPKRSASGKRIWLSEYVLLLTTYYGPAGEGPVYERTIYTTNEWFLEQIKNPKTEPRMPKAKPVVY